MRSEDLQDTPLKLQAALLWQSGAGLVGMLAAALYAGVDVAMAVGFGAGIAMLNTVLLGRRIGVAATMDPERGQRKLYAGAVLRFITVLFALMLAYAAGLHLLAVAAGMLLAQIAMFMYAARSVRREMAGDH